MSIGSHDDDEEVGESAFSDDDDTDQVPSEYTNLHHTGPNYGAFSSFGMPAERLNDSVTRHATDLYIEQQEAMKDPANADKEREPLLIKIIEDPEGQLKQIIVGQSTLPQTVFNSVNVLIGVGLLSLPLGLKYSGW